MDTANSLWLCSQWGGLYLELPLVACDVQYPQLYKSLAFLCRDSPGSLLCVCVCVCGGGGGGGGGGGEERDMSVYTCVCMFVIEYMHVYSAES